MLKILNPEKKKKKLWMLGHPMEVESIMFLLALKCASCDWILRFQFMICDTNFSVEWPHRNQ